MHSFFPGLHRPIRLSVLHSRPFLNSLALFSSPLTSFSGRPARLLTVYLFFIFFFLTFRVHMLGVRLNYVIFYSLLLLALFRLQKNLKRVI